MAMRAPNTGMTNPNTRVGQTPYGYALGPGRVSQPVTQPQGNTGVQAQQPAVSPALAAMNRPSVGGAPPSSPTTSNAAPAAPEARTDIYTATPVDTSRTDQLYTDMLAQSDQAKQDMMNYQNTVTSGLQRRNASNAARRGLAVGGASYLSGQRSAAVQGINAFNQALGAWNQQRQGIMAGQAGILSGAAGQNAGATNNAAAFNAGREGQIDDAKTAAQATQNASQNLAAVSQLNEDFSYLVNKNNLPGETGNYERLIKAYENALSTGNDAEIAAAYQAFMSFITPLQQAREAWLAAGGKDRVGSFKNFYKTNYGGR